MTPPDLDRLAADIEVVSHIDTRVFGYSVKRILDAAPALLAHVRAVAEERDHMRDFANDWCREYKIKADALAQMKLDLDIAQGAHEHDCGIFQERWCTCRVAPAASEPECVSILGEHVCQSASACPRQHECRDVRRAHDDLAAKMVTILHNLQAAPVDAHMDGKCGVLHSVENVHWLVDENARLRALERERECWEPGHVIEDDRGTRRATRVHCVICTDRAMEIARKAAAPVDAALLDRLVEAREWMDTVIHGGAKFAKGSTLVDGEHLLERIDAALMQEPATVDAAVVERVARALHIGWCQKGRPSYSADIRIWEECDLGHRSNHEAMAEIALRAARATRTDEKVKTVTTMSDAAEMLWVMLANVSGGDWTKQTPEWQDAAARWRDHYVRAVKEQMS